MNNEIKITPEEFVKDFFGDSYCMVGLEERQNLHSMLKEYTDVLQKELEKKSDLAVKNHLLTDKKNTEIKQLQVELEAVKKERDKSRNDNIGLNNYVESLERQVDATGEGSEYWFNEYQQIKIQLDEAVKMVEYAQAVMPYVDCGQYVEQWHKDAVDFLSRLSSGGTKPVVHTDEKGNEIVGHFEYDFTTQTEKYISYENPNETKSQETCVHGLDFQATCLDCLDESHGVKPTKTPVSSFERDKWKDTYMNEHLTTLELRSNLDKTEKLLQSISGYFMRLEAKGNIDIIAQTLQKEIESLLFQMNISMKKEIHSTLKQITQNTESKSLWIKTSDSLPQTDEPIIVETKSGKVYIGYYDINTLNDPDPLFWLDDLDESIVINQIERYIPISTLLKM